MPDGGFIAANGMIIGPEMPAIPDADVEEMRRLVAKIESIIGKPPTPPVYRDTVSQDTGDLVNVNSGAVTPGHKDGPGGNANALLSADYQAALAAYNQRFALLFAELKGRS